MVGEYDSPAAALKADGEAGELEPGAVVLCSLTLPGWQELVYRLGVRAPGSPILGVVDHITEEIAIEAISHGLTGCMDRSLALESWVEGIRGVHAGNLSTVLTVLRYPGAARQALMLLSQPPEPRGLRPLAPVLDHRERLA